MKPDEPEWVPIAEIKVDDRIVPLDTQDGEELVIDTDYTETYSDTTGAITTLYFLSVRDGEGNEFDYNELTSDITVARYPSAASAPA